MKELIASTALTAFAIVLMFGAWHLQAQKYKQNMREHCEQYYSIPEQHLDRVPDGCVPQYFEHKPEKEEL